MLSRAWPCWGISRLSFLQILVLAVVQGLTEFLPVSSSGASHPGAAADRLARPGLAIDVATHVGTLFAVLIYFWRDILRIGPRPGGSFCEANAATARLLVFYLLIGTIPALIAGYLPLKPMSAMGSATWSWWPGP